MPRLVHLCLALLVASIALLSVGNAAQADPTIGISQSYRNFGLKVPEQPYNPALDVSKSVFMSPLKISTFRVIVPWDLAGRPANDGRRQEFQNWLNTVNAMGAEPYVVFGPTELNTNLFNSDQYTRFVDNTDECDTVPDHPGDGPGCLLAPFAGTYRSGIQAFLAQWGPQTPGGVRLIGAWNEPNVAEVKMSIPNSTDSAVYLPIGVDSGLTGNKMSDPSCPANATTSNCGPLMAAYYWRYAEDELNGGDGDPGVCPAHNCYVVAGEFDKAPNANSYWNAYADQIESFPTGTGLPSRISFHGHQDVEPLGAHIGSSEDHDCKPGNVDWCITHNFAQWLTNRGGTWANRNLMPLWNTETGAEWASGTSSSTPDVAQNNRFNFLLDMSNNNQVSRLYYFNFQGSGTDRGLIDPSDTTVNTRVRPIWNTIRCRGSSGCATPTIVVRSSDGSLETYSFSAGAKVLSAGVQASTSPSVAALNAQTGPDNAPHEVAFQGTNGSLALYSSTSGFPSIGLGMASGTSPTVAALTNGSYEVAFQANTGTLWTYSQSAGATNITLPMAAGTDPNVAALTNGSYEVAFQSNTGSLKVYSPGGYPNLGLGMASGTSPDVAALTNGSYEVAFQANTGTLWTYSPSAGAANTGLAMAAGTDPSIIGLTNGSYMIAYQSSSGSLKLYSPSGAPNLNLGMATGTSPSITAQPNASYQVAFQANTGTLWIYSPSMGAANLGVPMTSGTNPSISWR